MSKSVIYTVFRSSNIHDTCKICNMTFKKQLSKSTTQLWTHLKCFHHDKFVEMND